MKLSSAKKLLEESDKELERIRKSLKNSSNKMYENNSFDYKSVTKSANDIINMNKKLRDPNYKPSKEEKEQLVRDVNKIAQKKAEFEIKKDKKNAWDLDRELEKVKNVVLKRGQKWWSSGKKWEEMEPDERYIMINQLRRAVNFDSPTSEKELFSNMRTDKFVKKFVELPKKIESIYYDTFDTESGDMIVSDRGRPVINSTVWNFLRTLIQAFTI